MHHSVNLIGQRPDLRTNQLLRLRLDDVSGDALDSSGNGFDGTVSGVTQGVAGHIGLAGQLDGVNDNIIITDAGLLVPLEALVEYTICGWASASSFNNYDSALSFGVSNDNDAVSLYPYNDIGGNGFSVWEDGTDTISGAGTVPADGSYHHFVWRRTSAILGDAFVDGVNQATSVVSKTTAASVDEFALGYYIGNGEFYTGNLDDWRVYTRALTDDQILSLSRL